MQTERLDLKRPVLSRSQPAFTASIAATAAIGDVVIAVGQP